MRISSISPNTVPPANGVHHDRQNPPDHPGPIPASHDQFRPEHPKIRPCSTNIDQARPSAARIPCLQWQIRVSGQEIPVPLQDQPIATPTSEPESLEDDRTHSEVSENSRSIWRFPNLPGSNLPSNTGKPHLRPQKKSFTEFPAPTTIPARSVAVSSLTAPAHTHSPTPPTTPPGKARNTSAGPSTPARRFLLRPR